MKPLKDSINETILTRKLSDPIRLAIEDWLEEYDIKYYTIKDNNEIDVDGDVNLYSKNIKKLPEYIQFGTVKGRFNCSFNKLKSLKGCPREVSGSFVCDFNNLTSLKGAPKKVGGGFTCSDNKLTSLEGAPKKVGGGFNCSYNKLKSLGGIPKDAEMRVDFICSHNNLTSLEGAPKKVGRCFDCSHNNLTSLKGAPEEVGKDFYCDYNTTKFTIDDVKKVSNVKGIIII